MNIEQLLQTYTQRLKATDIPSARLDCLILLEDATGKDRAWLLAHPDHTLDNDMIAELDEKIVRRSSHEPLAYIRETSEFYGRSFYVDKHVLEPRPESEAIIDSLKNIAHKLPENPIIIDIGTGSGALAITAKLELPTATVYGTDIDPTCLVVAQRNAAQLAMTVTFIQADLLQQSEIPILPTPDVVLANLPYVPNDFSINQAADHEPRLAIFGGPDGLDLYRKMFDQISQIEQSEESGPKAFPRYVITEALPPHHAQLAVIAEKAGYKLQSATGFVQVFARA